MTAEKLTLKGFMPVSKARPAAQPGCSSSQPGQAAAQGRQGPGTLRLRLGIAGDSARPAPSAGKAGKGRKEEGAALITCSAQVTPAMPPPTTANRARAAPPGPAMAPSTGTAPTAPGRGSTYGERQHPNFLRSSRRA